MITAPHQFLVRGFSGLQLNLNKNKLFYMYTKQSPSSHWLKPFYTSKTNQHEISNSCKNYQNPQTWQLKGLIIQNQKASTPLKDKIVGLYRSTSAITCQVLQLLPNS